jgi:hypothetical protein
MTLLITQILGNQAVNKFVTTTEARIVHLMSDLKVWTENTIAMTERPIIRNDPFTRILCGKTRSITNKYQATNSYG